MLQFRGGHVRDTGDTAQSLLGPAEFAETVEREWRGGTSPVSPVGADETELEGVLDGVGLVLATKACEADAVVHALRAVLVSDIEHDGLLAHIEQQPKLRSALGSRSPSEEGVLTAR